MTAVDIDLDGDPLSEAGIERTYTTKQAAEFFDKSVNWMYWGEGDPNRLDSNGNPDPDPPKFVRRDGTPVVPMRAGLGRKNQYRQWTLEDLRHIAIACYDRKNITEEAMVAILKRVYVPCEMVA